MLDKRPHAMKGHPLSAHAGSEQKSFMSSISNIVAEKNQKNEKLLRLMLDSRVVDMRMVYTHHIACPNPGQESNGAGQ